MTFPLDRMPPATDNIPPIVRGVIRRAMDKHAAHLRHDAAQGAPLMRRGPFAVWAHVNGAIGRRMQNWRHGSLVRDLRPHGVTRREVYRLARDLIEPLARCQWEAEARRVGVRNPADWREWRAANDRHLAAMNARNRVSPTT